MKITQQESENKMEIRESKSHSESSQKENNSRSASYHHESFYKSNEERINVYKRKLTNLVIGTSMVILVLIVERIFYEIFIDWEVSLLSSFQSAMGLIETVTITEKGEEISYLKYQASFIWDIFGYLDMFKYNFLLITAYFGVFFVAIDSLIAVKVAYISIFAEYSISIVSLCYGGSRPFWESDQIGSPVCLNTYSHPSRSTFITLFVIFYSLFCYQRRVQNNDAADIQDDSSQRQYKYIQIILSLVVFGLVFIKYIMGSDFIINIILGFIFFLIYFYTLVFVNSNIDSLIQKSTIQEKSAKKFVFYWFLYLVLSEGFATILYSSEDYYQPTDWIQNYVQCMKASGKLNGTLPFDEILGPWFTFIQSSCLFGLIGAVFGTAYTYRRTGKNYNWFRGTTKMRIIRSVILIATMIPSLVLSIYQNDLVNFNWVMQLGINEFFLSSFHYFILYFFLFGVLPQIFRHYKLINPPEEDDYKVLQPPDMNASFNESIPQPFTFNRVNPDTENTEDQNK